MSKVEIYRDSALTAQDVLALGSDHVILATGARWRRDAVGTVNPTPVPGWDHSIICTPEEVMAGTTLAGPIVVYDDDHYYMGGCLAERLRLAGHDVTLRSEERSCRDRVCQYV